MRSDVWQRVDRVLAEAMELDPAARSAFVRAQAGGDAEVEREVMSLLHADGDADSFMGDLFARDFIAKDLIAKDSGDLLDDLALGPEDDEDGSVEGRRMGPYRLLRRLGQGGMGTVYLAARDDEAYQQEVAIKVLSAAGQSRSELRARFRIERQVLANLVHPHIARLYDGGTTEDGRPYLVMEYVEGAPIDVYCDEQRLTIEERLALFRKVCEAVAFAHRNLVVHRDLKPGNILVSRDGTPRLLDFGIAKLLDAERFGVSAKTTRLGVRPMTPRYASPEQVRGEPITTATDVYALGVLLYQLLAGCGPYDAESTHGVEQAIVEHEPVRPSTAIRRAESTSTSTKTGAETDTPTVATIAAARRSSASDLRRRLRGDLDTIVLTALQKQPERRYGSAFALADDLERHQRSMPVLARPDTLAYRLGKFVRRHTLGVAAGTLAALVLVAFSVVTRAQAVRLEQERDVAQAERAKAQHVSAFLLDLLEKASPEQSRGEDITVGAVLDRAAESIAELKDQPEVQGASLATMGRVYTTLGRFEDAERLLVEAEAVQRATLGATDPDLGMTLSDLAWARLRLGDYAAAEVASREALAIGRATLPEGDVALASLLNTLGLILHNQGKYTDAEPLFRENVALVRQLHGAQAEELRGPLGSMAALLHDLGNYAEAETHYRESLALCRLHHGSDHPSVATVQGNLGVLLHDKGDYEQAEINYQQAVALRRTLLGNDHPGLYRTISNLARLRHDQGDLDEAERLYQQALDNHRATLQEGHPWAARTVSQLARLAYDQGNEPLAEERYQEALTVQRAALGNVHRRVGETLIGLGHLQLVTGQRTLALETISEALAIFEQKLAAGRWHQTFATILLRVAQGDANDPALLNDLRTTRRELAQKIGERAPAVRDLDALIAARE